jgi:hypothetical protein
MYKDSELASQWYLGTTQFVDVNGFSLRVQAVVREGKPKAGSVETWPPRPDQASQPQEILGAFPPTGGDRPLQTPAVRVRIFPIQAAFWTSPCRRLTWPEGVC